MSKVGRPVGSLGKDNLNHCLNLRLKDKQYDFLINQCKMLDISVSDYIRMIISVQMGLSERKEDANKPYYIDD